MAINVTNNGSNAIINVTGDFHLYNILDFKKTLLDLIYSDYRKVVIDMEGLGYFDSSFIGALLFANKKMRNEKRELSLMHIGHEARTILKVVNLEKEFKVYENADQLVQ